MEEKKYNMSLSEIDVSFSVNLSGTFLPGIEFFFFGKLVTQEEAMKAMQILFNTDVKQWYYDKKIIDSRLILEAYIYFNSDKLNYLDDFILTLKHGLFKYRSDFILKTGAQYNDIAEKLLESIIYRHIAFYNKDETRHKLSYVVNLLLECGAICSTSTLSDPRLYLPDRYRGILNNDIISYSKNYPNDIDIIRNSLDTPEILKCGGSYINKTDAYLRTMLHWSVINNNQKLYMMLVDYQDTTTYQKQQINLNLQDYLGRTALHYACLSNSVFFVEHLLNQPTVYNSVYTRDKNSNLAKDLTDNQRILHLFNIYEQTCNNL